jgi:CPA2 family monovalent cation:H+ antiporter-2
VLRQLDLPFVLVEIDHHRIDAARGAGRPVIFGDAAQPVVLEAAGVERARLLLVTTPVLGVSRPIVEHARRLNPEISIVARAESSDAMASLHELGVAEVVQPEIEASLEMTRQALLHLRMPALEIVHFTDRLREEQYAPVFERHGEHYPTLSRLGGATRLLDLRWIRIADLSPMAGRTIGDLAVRSTTGVSVAGLVHGSSFTAGPGPEARIEAGDLVAVVGDRRQIDAFEEAAAPASNFAPPPKGNP